MRIAKVHELLRHFNESSTQKTTKQLGRKINQDALKPCEHCAVAKEKQKNVHKESSGKRATDPNERWYHDIATMNSPKSSCIKVNKPVWYITVDKTTGMRMSGFCPVKGKMIKPICEWPHKQKEQGKPVKIIWQDNAGKNKKF